MLPIIWRLTRRLLGAQRRLCLVAISGAACLLLSACGLLHKDGDAQATQPRKLPPAVRVEVMAPDDLDELLETHLDIARLPARPTAPAIADSELSRLIAATPAQARELLESEGYFSPDVSVERLPGEKPAVRITVQPGPRVKVRDVRIDIQGPLAEHTARNEPHARLAQQALRHGWPLPPGEVFRNPVWSDAKRSALAQLRAQAYLDADWASTRAVVDASTRQADLTVIADSGPVYRTGELRIEGLHHHDRQTVRNLADFPAGSTATEQRLLDYQERLLGSNLFEAATVQYKPVPARPGATPVSVSLTECKLQDATVGLGIDANVGARATFEHTHRRLLGRPLIARNRLEASQVRRGWAGEVSTHALPRLWRNHIGGAAERIESDSDVVTSARLRIGRSQDKHRIDRLIFVEAERSLQRGVAGRQASNALSGHYHGIWRQVDDVLLPTRGHVLAAQVGLGQASSNPGDRGPFGRIYARLHSFIPIGRWHLATRVEAGQVFVRSGVLVPDSMRFRAGGDESVRGYAYRELAPKVNGQLTGGRVLFTTSAELARPILARLPELWGAVFVDAGRAANRWGDVSPAIGVGVGVRYRSPIGPLKLDLAYGEDVRRFRLHLTVGVAF